MNEQSLEDKYEALKRVNDQLGKEYELQFIKNQQLTAQLRKLNIEIFALRTNDIPLLNHIANANKMWGRVGRNNQHLMTRKQLN